MTPQEIVAGQLNAYNAKDLDGFLSYWDADAEYYAFPDTLLARGHEEIRARHVERFREPDLYGRLVSRTELSGFVVDQEVVTRNFPEGLGTLDVVCVYEVKGEKITRAWFLSGTKTILSGPS